MLEKRIPKSFIGSCKPASHELLFKCFFKNLTLFLKTATFRSSPNPNFNKKYDSRNDYYLFDFVVRDIKIAVYLESPRKFKFNLVSDFLSK